jgi:cereblon
MMLMFVGAHGTGGNGAKAYQCIRCGGLITHSDQLIPVRGANRHLFTNPAGIECDFHTFTSCTGAMTIGEATEAQTWFPGYGWSFALCRHCGQHLGWHYEAVLRSERPREFWGILVSHLSSG